jgi:hypothetical protein
MDDTSHIRYEEYDGHMDRETPLDLMAIVGNMKTENERLMRSQAKQTYLNAELVRNIETSTKMP